MLEKKQGRKIGVLMLCIIASMMLLAGCGKPEEATITFNADGGKLKSEETLTVSTDDPVGELPAPTKKGYTFCGWYDKGEKLHSLDYISKDMDVTAKWVKKDQKIKVSFDANDGKENIIDSVEVTANEGIASDKMPKQPTRKGYYFAGWQTKSEVKEEDIVGGVSKYLYFFGESKSMVGIWNQEYESIQDKVATIDSLTEKNEATLYARWVEMKDITNKQELQDISKDLYGAYRLTEDIDISGKWQPIGSYYENYELLNDNWWVHSFHGTFDGNGKTISGLNITSLENKKEVGLNAIVSEGKKNDGTAAIFGSVTAPAVIKDVTIDQATIQANGEGGAVYTAPLIGFMMGGDVSDVTVTNANIQITAKDAKDSNLYVSVSGLIGGFWGGTVSDCSTQGDISLEANGANQGAGSVYCGGLVGECYSDISGCTSQVNIKMQVDAVDSKADENMQIYAGGLTGSNCNMKKCQGDNNLDITVNKNAGGVLLYAGLGIGSERYGNILDCVAKGTLKVNGTTQEAAKYYQGSILGGFDTDVVAMIGGLMDPELKTRHLQGCSTDNQDLPAVGCPYENTDMMIFEVENVQVIAK